jgi:hypothetical protein
MTNFPNGTPNRALKWNPAGTDLVNSAYDPDLLAETTADLAKAAARSAEQAAEAAYDATVKAGTMAAKLDQAITLSAQVAADAAQVAADKAVVEADTAQVIAARDATLAAKADAQAAATQAATAKTDAQAARDAAQSSAAVAANSATQAQASATNAAASATAAHASEVNAASSATSAQTSATNAAASATAAHSSEVNAATSATAADGSATNAANSATAAHSSELNAASSATSAQTAATNAAASASSAASSATTAQTYAQQVVTAAGQVSASQADIGLLYLGLARVDSPTSPNVGGTQVADEFDDASGIGSFGGAIVTNGYLTNADYASTNGLTGGTASNASGNTNGTQYPNLAFDGDASTWFQSNGPARLVYDLGAGNAKVLGKFVIDVYADSQGSGLATGTIDVSNDGSSWTTLITLSGLVSTQTNNQIYTFTSPNSTAYRYYSINGQTSYRAGGFNAVLINQFKGYPLLSPSNITTVSAAYTAQAAPTAVTLVAEYQNVGGSAVVNTDITFEVSRDNGTSWTSVTMADFGPSPTGGRVLKGSSDVSGQPSGTQVKWRIKTFNAKEQRVHGIWMQWK